MNSVRYITMLQNPQSVDEFISLVRRMNEETSKLDNNNKQDLKLDPIDNDPLPSDLMAEIENDDHASSSEDYLGNKEQNGGSDSMSWFVNQCEEYITQRGSDAAFSAEELQQTLLGILESDSSDDELQATFAEMLGYEHLDFVIGLIQRRQEIAAASRKPFTAVSNKGLPHWLYMHIYIYILTFFDLENYTQG